MERMKPEMVVDILRNEGLNITLEEAKQILELIYILVEIAVTQTLQDEDS